MSGETAKQESGWTVDTLKQHYDQRFADSETAVSAALVSQEKAVAAALAAAKEAVAKAETASEKRFDAVNEFRQTLTDQTNTFLPRPEYNAQHKALEEKVDIVTKKMNLDRGGEISMGKIYAAVGAVGAILGMTVLLANNVFG